MGWPCVRISDILCNMFRRYKRGPPVAPSPGLAVPSLALWCALCGVLLASILAVCQDLAKELALWCALCACPLCPTG